MSTPLLVRSARLGWAFSFISNMPKIPYTKPTLTFAAQLSQLKQRGLTVEDDNKCLFLLETISYIG